MQIPNEIVQSCFRIFYNISQLHQPTYSRTGKPIYSVYLTTHTRVQVMECYGQFNLLTGFYVHLDLQLKFFDILSSLKRKHKN